MTVNLSNSLAALSLLGNTNSFADFGSTSAPAESRAVRIAKAQFDAPATTPPWKLTPVRTPVSSQVAAIKRMPSIIDKDPAATSPAQRDIQTSFTAYKALDRLRLLAEASAAPTTSTGERLLLDGAFARGLTDLQAFLAAAPVDRLGIAFAEPTPRAASLGEAITDPGTVKARGVATVRADGLAGLTGTEQFRIDLTKGSVHDSYVIDLAAGPQPPTLDSVVAQANAAISAEPARDSTGTILVDADGVVLPKWQVKLGVEKTGTSWGLTIKAPNINERIAIDQIGGTDALQVATGLDADGAAAATRLYRFDDAGGALERRTLATLTATDRVASATAALTAPKSTIKGVTLASTQVAAAVTARAIATDATGNSYVVGTASGDVGSNRSSGNPDLLLTKLDSEGSIVWQRTLGASGSASGAAVSVAGNGDVVVAGTVSGSFNGATSDGDLVVARYDSNGEEKQTTLVTGTGADTASAIAVGTDGSIFVGGRAATAGGDAFVARIDANGRVADRRSIDGGGSDAIKALAIGADGNLLALVNSDGSSSVHRLDAAALGTDLGSLSLGTVDARAIAVAGDGRIAVVGAQTISGDRNGYVARIDAGLAGAQVTGIATGGDDQVDSVAWLGGKLQVGGRTSGNLAGARTGSVDAFVARIDPATGSVEATRQFGVEGTRAAPVEVAGAAGGSTALAALGLHRGVLNPVGGTTLVAQTSVRAGDEFSIRIGTGATVRIVIAADDTAATLATRIGRLTGNLKLVTAPKGQDTTTLRFQATATTPITLLAGPEGTDALAKLGIEPVHLLAPRIVVGAKPQVKPGGNFGLDLSHALHLTTAADAGAAVKAIKAAIGTTQSAYRSLYWDAGKAALADGYAGNKPLSAAVSAANAKQLAGYQAALARLTPVADTTTATVFTGF